jgi:hypothetical protein
MLDDVLNLLSPILSPPSIRSVCVCVCVSVFSVKCSVQDCAVSAVRIVMSWNGRKSAPIPKRSGHTSGSRLSFVRADEILLRGVKRVNYRTARTQYVSTCWGSGLVTSVRTSARHPTISKRGRTDAACGETVPEWGSEESSLPHNVRTRTMTPWMWKQNRSWKNCLHLWLGKKEKQWGDMKQKI